MGGPFLGVLFHWIGGFAAASFYVPYRQVRKWSWETYWLVGGVFSWIIAPWLLALALTNDLLGVLASTPASTLGWAYLFGAMWGIGGLTFGLALRYLGMSLGMGIALGFCAAFGTLIPPIFDGKIGEVLSTTSGQLVLLGVLVCLAGIGVAALAGLNKEREMSDEQKHVAIKEFNFKKGVLVAVFSGILSASMAYGIKAAKPIEELTKEAGTDVLYSGLPSLVVVLLGGFTTNAIWCICLNIRNRTGYQYLSANARAEHAELVAEGGEAPSATQSDASAGKSNAATQNTRVPRFSNYIFCMLAGVTWYFQFFFYTMGETQMGKFEFSSWTLHMASIIIFSTLWGVALREWRGSSRRTHWLITAGIALLVISTLIIGYGTLLSTEAATGGH